MLPTLSRVLFLILALLLLTSGSAAARGNASRVHFDKGIALYHSGRYADAIAQFESGYSIEARPSFLLNIAQCWRRLGDLERARIYYHRFVEAAPSDDPARAQALAAIEKIDHQIGPAPPVTPPSTATPPPAEKAPPVVVMKPFEVKPEAPPSPPRPRSRTPGLVGIGVAAFGVAALGAAAGLTVEAQSLDQRYAHPSSGATYDPSLRSRRDLTRNLAYAFYGVGGALTVAGVALIAVFLPPARARRNAAASPAIAVRPVVAVGQSGVVGGVSGTF